MPRAPKNPEGARVNVTIRLPQKHLDALDASASKAGISRSDAVIRLVERLATWVKP